MQRFDHFPGHFGGAYINNYFLVYMRIEKTLKTFQNVANYNKKGRQLRQPLKY
jgi:hypothetical protein